MSNSLVDANGSRSGISGTSSTGWIVVRGVGSASLRELAGILETKIGDNTVWIHERVGLSDKRVYSQTVAIRRGSADILDS